MITINLDKAKEVKKEMLRRERAPLLEQLDVQFQRALEAGSNTTEIVAEKQRLRDITQVVDTAPTFDAVKAITVE